MTDQQESRQVPTRILYVDVDDFAIVRFRSELITRIIEDGGRITVASGHFSKENRATLEGLGAGVAEFHLNRTGLNPMEDRRTRSELRRMIEAVDPDVLIARAAKSVAYALPVAESMGVKRRIGFMTGLGTMFYPNSWFERAAGLVGRRIIRKGLASANEIWVLNPDNEERLRGNALRGIPIHNLDSDGVDLEQFKPAPLQRDPAFCFIGRLLPAKGASAFLEAAIRIHKVEPRIRFIVAGETDRHRGAISKEDVRSLHDQGVIEYRGFVEDLSTLFAECRALVLTSVHEGRPRSVIEALACGRPVVVSDAPGCRDVITDGREGRVVQLGDTDQLCEVIMDLAGDLDSAERMSHHARQLAETRYGARQACDRFMNRIALGQR